MYLVSGFAGSVQAADDDDMLRLPEVIVTAPGDDGSLRTVPHSVSVISADDIRRSASTSVVDLLSREANLSLRSFYGSDKYAGVDMRGMGDTAGSNVLILVDGVRLNEVDLSGADLSSIPLSQIERIEIIRGGGAVQYGNGAVGGVINILTKRGAVARNDIELRAGMGSYGLVDTRLHARGGAGPLAISLNASNYESDGFRDNSYLNSRNTSAEIRLVAPGGLDFLETYLRVGQHRDQNGFPGPVGAADFAAGSASRRATNTPNDFGETDDTVYTGGLFADFGRAGRIDMQASRRERRNDYVLGYNPLLSREAQLSTIQSQRQDISLRYENSVDLFGRPQTLTIGVNRQLADYARYANGRYIADQSERKLGDVDDRAAFIAATFRPFSGVAVNAGWRTDRFATNLSDEKYTRNCTYNWVTIPGFPPIPVLIGCTPYAYGTQNQRSGNWRNQGAELGVSWRPNVALSLFTSATQHFRNPNVDELVLAASDLRPQQGHTVEAGTRWTARQGLELGLSLFRMRIRDEIYYGADPASGLSANRNYEQATQRTGGEFEMRWQASPVVALRANVGYIVPRFVGGDADIPHVPRQTANVQGEWAVTSGLSWSMAVRYSGSRFDGNDLSNRAWPKLPAYTVVDTALRYANGPLEFAVGVFNLFDRAYSTLGYSATYYPMPERNFFARVRLAL